MVKKIHILFSILFLIQEAFAQKENKEKEWTLSKEKRGIKVYTRDRGNRGLKELKSVAEFKNVSLHQIAAVLKDVENAGEWTKELKRSTTLKVINEQESYEYYEINIPWPIKNRDVIYHIKTFQDPKDKSLNVIATSVPKYIPEKDGVVRIIESAGAWKFIPKGNGIVEVHNYLYADPIGFPAWLVNMLAIESPIEVIEKFREMVKKPEYKNKHFNFIKE